MRMKPFTPTLSRSDGEREKGTSNSQATANGGLWTGD